MYSGCAPSPHQQVVVAGFGLHHPTIWSYGHTTLETVDLRFTCAFSVAGPVCRNTLPDY